MCVSNSRRVLIIAICALPDYASVTLCIYFSGSGLVCVSKPCVPRCWPRSVTQKQLPLGDLDDLNIIQLIFLEFTGIIVHQIVVGYGCSKTSGKITFALLLYHSD